MPSSTLIDSIPQTLNFNQLFLKLNQFTCNSIDYPNWWGRAISEGDTTFLFAIKLVPPKDIRSSIVHPKTINRNTIHR